MKNSPTSPVTTQRKKKDNLAVIIIDLDKLTTEEWRKLFNQAVEYVAKIEEKSYDHVTYEIEKIQEEEIVLNNLSKRSGRTGQKKIISYLRNKLAQYECPESLSGQHLRDNNAGTIVCRYCLRKL